MDIQAIIAQISAALADAPEKIKDFVSDPKGTIEELTGHSVGDADLSEIVDGMKNGIAGGVDNLGDLAGNLGDMLEKTPLGGIADSLGGLFGKK